MARYAAASKNLLLSALMFCMAYMYSMHCTALSRQLTINPWLLLQSAHSFAATSSLAKCKCDHMTVVPSIAYVTAQILMRFQYLHMLGACHTRELPSGLISCACSSSKLASMVSAAVSASKS